MKEWDIQGYTLNDVRVTRQLETTVLPIKEEHFTYRDLIVGRVIKNSFAMFLKGSNYF